MLFLLYLLILKKQNVQKEFVSCINRRFGCCPDDITQKKDIHGSNCRGF